MVLTIRARLRSRREPPEDAVVGWAIVRSEEHLRSIRMMLAWILFFVLVSVLIGVIAAVELAEDSSSGF